MDPSSISLKKLLCVSSENESKEKSGRRAYSRETLMILAKNAPSQEQPECLSPDCFGEDGVWDPEKWHLSLESSTLFEGGRKTLESNDLSEESNVVLGPQRRSFQGGCHVVSKEKPVSSFSRTLSQSGSRLSERGSKLSRSSLQDSEHNVPHLKRFHSLQSDSSDWSRDSDNKKSYEKLEPAYARKSRSNDYRRFASGSSRRKHSDSSYYDHQQTYYEESEPEWISYGPKSQFDTIELSGFEEADDFSWMGREIPMDDVPERMKKDSRKKEEKREPSPIEDLPSSKEPSEDGLLEEDVPESTPLEDENEEKNLSSEEDAIGNTLTPVTAANVNGIDSPLTESETAKTEPSVDDFFAPETDSSHESRFRRWFSGGVNVPANGDTDLSLDQKMVDDLTSEPITVKKDEPLLSVLKQQPNESTEITKPEVKEMPGVTASSTARITGMNDTDAFNRLIASIRATDKVKEEMQQRNQKIQALQNMMNSTKNNFHLSTIENAGEPSLKSIQTSNLKFQLEKQKDVIQQKLRQIEEKQKSTTSMFPGQDLHSLQMNQGMLGGFSGQTSRNPIHEAVNERAAATASLAAKLASKKDDSHKLLSNPTLNERLMKLKRLQSVPTDTANTKPLPIAAASQNNMKNNSLLIAQMLASAGVTEEQLKQLTLEQQELVISMVQNQFTQKDVAKRANVNSRNHMKLPEASASSVKPLLPMHSHPQLGAGSSTKDLYSSKALPATADVRHTNSANTSLTNNTISLLNENPSTAHPLFNENSMHHAMATSTLHPTTNLAQVTSAQAQSRMFSRNVLPLHPTIVSPMVPLMSPSMAPHMIAPALAPSLAHLVQTPTQLAPPYPAVLLQLQQQFLAGQLAQQQQQQAVFAAAIQKQQQLAAAAHMQSNNDVAKLQQSLQNAIRGSSRPGTSDGTTSAQERTHFNNLSQWFSGDVLRQSRFPPVSQLTGQQTMKLSNNPSSIDPSVHTTKP